MDRQTLEREFFRKLNSVVEPAVRKGLGSPRIWPSGLILLETTGFKTGVKRRTPLLATRLGKYVFVSTFRADRSFWIRNLRKQPRVFYLLGLLLIQLSYATYKISYKLELHLQTVFFFLLRLKHTIKKT